MHIGGKKSAQLITFRHESVALCIGDQQSRQAAEVSIEQSFVDASSQGHTFGSQSRWLREFFRQRSDKRLPSLVLLY